MQHICQKETTCLQNLLSQKHRQYHVYPLTYCCAYAGILLVTVSVSAGIWPEHYGTDYMCVHIYIYMFENSVCNVCVFVLNAIQMLGVTGWWAYIVILERKPITLIIYNTQYEWKWMFIAWAYSLVIGCMFLICVLASCVMFLQS